MSRRLCRRRYFVERCTWYEFRVIDIAQFSLLFDRKSCLLGFLELLKQFGTRVETYI